MMNIAENLLKEMGAVFEGEHNGNRDFSPEKQLKNVTHKTLDTPASRTNALVANRMAMLVAYF